MRIGSRAPQRRGAAFVGVVLAGLLGFAALAVSMSDRGDAAFPGVNGRIAFASGDSYYYSSAAIWAANADGGAPTLLNSGPGVSAPSYSTDGARIAFDREGGVAVMSATGTGLAQLLSGSNSQASWTEWKEDYVDPHSGKTIPIVKIQSFADEWQTFDHPAFSPNGAQLVVSEAGGRRTNRSICAVEAPNEQTCLGFGNPDAYFDYEYDCDACGAHLIAINSATGARIGALTALEDERRDTKPTYSADGKVAFARSSKGSSSIFVIDAPGAAPRRVTNGQSDRTPDFSPDSSRIVFSHGYADIGLVGVGGGAVQLLPVPPLPAGFGGYVNSPAFSPDGSRIVLRRAAYGPGGADQSGLFTMALDGSGFTRIAAAGYAPSWQPVSPPPPPAIRAKARVRKGKVRLNRKGRAKVGTITCGGTPCKLKVLSAKLQADRTSCRQVRTRLAKKLGPGKRARLGVKVFGQCLTALEKAGKGRLMLRVRVVDGLGKKVLKLGATLVPATAKPDKHGGK